MISNLHWIEFGIYLGDEFFTKMFWEIVIEWKVSSAILRRPYHSLSLPAVTRKPRKVAAPQSQIDA